MTPLFPDVRFVSRISPASLSGDTIAELADALYAVTQQQDVPAMFP